MNENIVFGSFGVNLGAHRHRPDNNLASGGNGPGVASRYPGEDFLFRAPVSYSHSN